ncbi:hypothetical protein O9G_003296 [Rozella allomycis CSF55]|uniref:Uncharacterized protein n=1 Tax=Rozella allomycis (strain CSF55) TaxID=988480 RepID=A0A075AUH8_ROZAC|nr:hypothetical protein O9G_003296 [Rozella allomycis CSF55]|eukprot:EPZ32157.1 hypothetical protein O9G_003296 [Rozella allomycis CSF55]
MPTCTSNSNCCSDYSDQCVALPSALSLDGIEERMLRFWSKYQTYIIYGGAGVAVIAVGLIARSVIKSRARSRMENNKVESSASKAMESKAKAIVFLDAKDALVGVEVPFLN